ncbi:MAG: DUF5995 family protein [Acidobacteriota bacterium]|nr:DUF5995 family protein [Acidobacteriota bacterium]
MVNAGTRSPHIHAPKSTRGTGLRVTLGRHGPRFAAGPTCYYLRQMTPKTIQDVISALDAIVQQAHENASRLGYFAALYRRVTCAVRDGIANGQFQNGPLMEQLDVNFANRYLDALATYQSGGTPPRSWLAAFKACDDGRRLILQQLLAGMNAHINLDLGIAAAQTRPGKRLPELKPDFDQINGVLGDLIGTVAAEIAAVSPLIGNLEAIGLRDETTIVNFDMTAARNNAWCTAQRLAIEPSALHPLTIDGLDLAVSVAGNAILYPLEGEVGLAVIGSAEVSDVRQVIEVLSQTDDAVGQTAGAN